MQRVFSLAADIGRLENCRKNRFEKADDAGRCPRMRIRWLLALSFCFRPAAITSASALMWRLKLLEATMKPACLVLKGNQEQNHMFLLRGGSPKERQTHRQPNNCLGEQDSTVRGRHSSKSHGSEGRQCREMPCGSHDSKLPRWATKNHAACNMAHAAYPCTLPSAVCLR